MTNAFGGSWGPKLIETFESTKKPEFTLWISVPEGTAGARKASDFKWWSTVEGKLTSSGAFGSPALLKKLVDRPLIPWADRTLGEVVSLQTGSNEWPPRALRSRSLWSRAES